MLSVSYLQCRHIENAREPACLETKDELNAHEMESDGLKVCGARTRGESVVLTGVAIILAHS
jgi:hypothetical protein